jgi:hypothetical protein
MTRIEFQTEMLGGHLAGVIGRPSGDSRPKLSNLREMDRPIFNVLVEYRANQFVLSDIRVQMSQQGGETLPLSNPSVKTSNALIHVVLATALHKIHLQKMYYKYIFHLNRMSFKRS